MATSDTAPIKTFVDQLSDDVALLVWQEDSSVQFTVPRNWLPPELTAGDHLWLSFHLDPASKQTTLENLHQLRQELSAGQDPAQLDFKL